MQEKIIDLEYRLLANTQTIINATKDITMDVKTAMENLDEDQSI